MARDHIGMILRVLMGGAKLYNQGLKEKEKTPIQSNSHFKRGEVVLGEGSFGVCNCTGVILWGFECSFCGKNMQSEE